MSQKSQTNRIEAAASLIDERAERIGIVKLQMNRLRTLGVLVDVDARGLSMFQRAASFAEWGIADADERKARMRGGVKVLIPLDAFKRLRSLEQRYRQNLERFSLPVAGFHPYRLVPFTAYKAWRAKALEISREWQLDKESIIANLDAYADDLAREFAAMARRAWKSIKAQQFDAVEINGQRYRSEAAFVDALVARAVEQLPSAERITTGLTLDYRTALTDSDDADVAATLDTLDAEYAETYRAMLEEERQHQAAMLESMRQPLDEITAHLNERIFETVASMRASIQKNGFVRGKIAEQGAGLLEFFDMMTFGTGPKELRGAISALKKAIGPVGAERARNDERNVADVLSAIDDIAALARSSADSMTTDERFSALELDD